jgi:molybdenum cofactor synthesis domain-containing protein
MSSSTPELTAAVITVSDSSARGERVDLGGPAVAAALEKKNFKVVAREIVADDEAAIRDILLRLTTLARFVVTTGGTGTAHRDVTPEGYRAVVIACSRVCPSACARKVGRPQSSLP